MAASQQQTAIAFAQSMLQLTGQLQAIRNQVAALVYQYTDLAPSTVWSNLTTHSVNSDGSPGADDTTPNTSHPISVNGLNRSANQLSQAVQLLSDFQTWTAANLTSTSTARNIIIDQLVG